MKTKFPFILTIFSLLALAGCEAISDDTHSSGDQSSTSESSSSSSSDSSTSSSTSTSGESKKDFEGIIFNNAEFTYDGNAHSIYVSGAPDFATVTYTGNNKVNVGTYSVSAKIEAANYNTLVKTATLTIKGKTISGVTFESKSFTYDGNSHSLVATNLPSGVSVTYTNNNKVNAGTYTVTANLSGTGYVSLKLTATLTITPTQAEGSFSFSSKAFAYDGNDHYIDVYNPPKGATVTYRCLNKTGTNTFKDPGCYEIEATIKVDNNHLSKRVASLVIVTSPSISIDSSKTPLTINDSLTWDQLHDALNNGNYTIKQFSGNYPYESVSDPLPEGLFDDDFSGHSSGFIFGTDGKEAFNHSYSLPLTSESNHYYDFYQEYNDSIVHIDTGSVGVSKFPKIAFKETVLDDYASYAFAGLTKGSSGEFDSGTDHDSFYSDIGNAFIEDGIFTVLLRHTHGSDFVYEIYRFYNIGNTKVTIPNYLPSKSIIDGLGIDKFYYGGVRYGLSYVGSGTSGNYYYAAELFVDYHRSIFLAQGTYTVLPTICNRIVKAIIYTSRLSVYYTIQTGYNFRLYINEDKSYQGEYSSYGSLDYFSISEFTSHGGTVEYYDQWHS